MKILFVILLLLLIAYGFHKGFTAEPEIDIERENMRNLYGDNTK